MERELSPAEPAQPDDAAAAPPPRTGSPLRIAMVVHSYYDEDPRVRREAETLIRAGHSVTVFGLRRTTDDPAGELDGVAIRRLDVQRHQGAGIGTYLREYLSFLVRSGWALTRAHRRQRFDLVHIHSLPDFLAFAALPLRLAGVPLLLDLHEAMPEFFRTRFPRSAHPLAHRLLVIQERVSIALSSAVVTVNPALADRLVALGVARAKVGVVPNGASLARFEASAHPARSFAEDGVVRFVYAGALTPTYELDIALGALAHVAAARPELRFVLDVYGRGDAEADLRAQADRLGIADRVVFHGRIPIDDVPAAIAAADIGLAPTRHDRFTDASLSTKVFEYAAMRKPVIATRLPLVTATFPIGTVWTYQPASVESMADAIGAVLDDPVARAAAVERTLAVVREASWDAHAPAFVALVERLAERRRA